MSKRATWVACSTVAVGLVAIGVALDRLLATGFVLAVVGAVVASAYLAGTFATSVPLFGPVARPREGAGRFSLTFDDGPAPGSTPAISRFLAERGHRATFFVLGRHARAYPHLLEQLLADGHELANHGYDHRLLAFSRPRSLRTQLEATESAVLAATRRPPARLFRAPHGVRSPWLWLTVRRLGYRVCGWTGSAFDTARPGARTIAERICGGLRPGGILLLHDADGSGRGDSRQQTVEALGPILAEAERRGLRSVCLSALLEPPSQQTTEPGRRNVPVVDGGGHAPEGGERETLVREEDEAETETDGELGRLQADAEAKGIGVADAVAD
jgi:peptidoglycan/xylan/chitin deacetylase (PgdA/CDA1 family)